MKLVQSEIQRDISRVRESRDPDREFERLKTLQNSENSERFVVEKEFNV
jgi:hypothetical protein